MQQINVLLTIIHFAEKFFDVTVPERFNPDVQHCNQIQINFVHIGISHMFVTAMKCCSAHWLTML